MQEQPTPTKENEASALNCSGAWTEDGYIKDQDLLTGYTYRTIPAMQNSCGPVAVFNLAHDAHPRADFHVCDAQSPDLLSAGLAGGAWQG